RARYVIEEPGSAEADADTEPGAALRAEVEHRATWDVLIPRAPAAPAVGSNTATSPHPNHVGALFFAGLTLVPSPFFYWGLRPSIDAAPLRYEAPPLAYVLVLIILLGWILSSLAFHLDKYRIPPELVIVIAVATVYFVTGTDHSYKVHNF